MKFLKYYFFFLLIIIKTNKPQEIQIDPFLIKQEVSKTNRTFFLQNNIGTYRRITDKRLSESLLKYIDKKLFIFAARYGITFHIDYQFKDNPLNVNFQDEELNNNTPLHEAVINLHYPIVKILLEKGAKPNIYNNYGTPLHYIASRKFDTQEEKELQLEIEKLLLAYGSNIELKTKKMGFNVRHIAAAHGNLELIELIDKHIKVKWDTLTKDNRTALDLAKENGHFKLVEFLKSKYWY